MKLLPKLVFFTQDDPEPPISGAKIRDHCLMKALSEKYDVELLVASKFRRDTPSFFSRALAPIRPYVVNGYSSEIAHHLTAHAKPGTILWISRLGLAQYIPQAVASGYTVVLDEHNVESDLWLRSILPTPRYWPHFIPALQCAYYEARFCRMAHFVVATSNKDASLLRRLAPKVPIHVLPNPVDCDRYASARNPSGSTLLFTGTLSYHPNFEGLRWFITKVLPIVRAQMGSELPRVVVAGANPPDWLKDEVSTAGLELQANPESMLPLLAEAKVVFVPLLSGSGTRLKILEAMAAAKPVISTSKGAEGLEVKSGSDILIADDPNAFADGLVRLLRDSTLRENLSRNALMCAQDRYDWRQLRGPIDSLHAEIEATK